MRTMEPKADVSHSVEAALEAPDCDYWDAGRRRKNHSTGQAGNEPFVRRLYLLPVTAAPEAGPVPHDQRVALLDAVPAFHFFPRVALDRMAALMEVEDFPAGADVVREGEDGDRLYLIVEGAAQAWTGRAGWKVVLADLEAGGLFGELALLTPNATRHATVTSLTPLRALTLDRAAFHDILATCPPAQRFLTGRTKLKLAAKFLRVNLLYRLSFEDPRRERLFLSSVSFLITFASARGIAAAVRAGKGPFRNITGPGGTHIHHLVWGILLLLGVGYAWLVQIGTGMGEARPWTRATAISYGIGSALTLDEFALWLNLEDVYWAPEGRRSIDAVVLFAAFLSVGLWGRPFWQALFRFLLPSR